MKKVEVYVFGGLGWPFTAGGVKRLELLIENLSPDWESHVLPYWDWEKASDEVIKKYKNTNQRPLIIVGGHSWGALVATWFAKRLKTHGIQIDYLFGIDPTATTNKIGKIDVPTNVNKIDEFWSMSPFINFPFHARKSAPDGSRGGKFTVPKSLSKVHSVFKIQSGHIATASNKTTINRVIKTIYDLTK